MQAARHLQSWTEFVSCRGTSRLALRRKLRCHHAPMFQDARLYLDHTVTVHHDLKLLSTLVKLTTIYVHYLGYSIHPFISWVFDLGPYNNNKKTKYFFHSLHYSLSSLQESIPVAFPAISHSTFVFRIRRDLQAGLSRFSKKIRSFPLPLWQCSLSLSYYCCSQPNGAQANTTPRRCKSSPTKPHSLSNDAPHSPKHVFNHLTINFSRSTASGQLDAAISQIAASYFPSSLQPSLAVALESASVTGDINSVVASFITAANPPPFVTNSALAPFSSRIAKAESLISSLTAGVYSATHTTANNTISANGTLGIVTTETASNGSAVVTTLPAHVVNGSTVEGAATTSGAAVSRFHQLL